MESCEYPRLLIHVSLLFLCDGVPNFPVDHGIVYIH